MRMSLDLPWYQQYYNFLTRLVRFDLGTSFRTLNRPVWDIIKDGLPVSAELSLWALVIQIGVGVPVGVVSALRANTWTDTLNMGLALIVYAILVFVLGILCQLLIIWLDNVTGGSWPNSQWGTPWSYSWSDIQYKLVPILVYGAAGMAYFARLARTSMLEVLRQDYVRTARAKGLLEAVVYRHALRNALIPLVTIIGLSVSFLVSGAFFMSIFFSIPGIARITLILYKQSRLPCCAGNYHYTGGRGSVGDLLSDILYTVVDPRIRLE